MPINLPYPIYGTVYNTDGTTGIGSGITVRARNNSTNETIEITTNSSSMYPLDAGNFSSGYDNDDKITVYVIYTNLEAETTLTISDNLHQFNLTLSTITDSSLINICNVQDVWDALDEIGASDTSAKRIVKAIQRAESQIQERAGIKFSSTTETQEIYDYNEITTSRSPEQNTFVGGDVRNDNWSLFYRDRLFLRNRPIVSITTLQRNTASASSTDSWETLTENIGSSGDYVLTPEGKSSGYVDFVNKKPRYGKRAVRITYKHGYSTTPKNVERLGVLLATKDIVLSKISRSFYDSPNPLGLRGIMIDRTNSFKAYLNSIKEEVDDLFETSVGTESRVI